MLLLAAGATALGGRLVGSRAPSPSWMVAFTATVLVAYASRGLYAPRLCLSLIDDVRKLVIGTALAASFVVTAEIVVDGSVPVAYGILRLAGFACAYVTAGRVALSWSQARARAEVNRAVRR